MDQIVPREERDDLPDGLLAALRGAGMVVERGSAVPDRGGRVAMYLAGAWYSVVLPVPPPGTPVAETLDVLWYGQPEQAIVVGWPAEQGAIAGVALAWWGRDSLRGTLLFDERLAPRARPGLTAQFTAGRAP